jgi:pimeloyl-ACP methyl ester carboxylesterase
MSYLDEGATQRITRWSWCMATRRGRFTSATSSGRWLRCAVWCRTTSGWGRRPNPPPTPTRSRSRIADLEALVDSLGLRSLDLVVHDWGGAIGLGLAARRPDRIRRIAALNTAAFPSQRIPGRIALCRAPLLGPLLVRGCNAFAGPATWMAMHRRRLSAVERQAYLWPYDSWASRVAVHAFVSDIPMQPGHRSWATLQAVERGLAQFRERPVLAIWGLRDFCFDASFLRRWCDLLPNTAAHGIADAGHYVLEDAREEVLARLTPFLTRA